MVNKEPWLRISDVNVLNQIICKKENKRDDNFKNFHFNLRNFMFFSLITGLRLKLMNLNLVCY